MEERRDYTEIVNAVIEGVKPSIEEVIDKKVNGKIDRLTEKNDDLTKTIYDHLVEDKNWKEKTDKKLDALKPASQGIQFMQMFGVGVKWASGVVVAMMICVGAFITFIKYISSL